MIPVCQNYYKGSATLIFNEKPPNKIQIRPRIREKKFRIRIHSTGWYRYSDRRYLEVPVLSLVFMEIRNILMELAPGIDTYSPISFQGVPVHSRKP